MDVKHTYDDEAILEAQKLLNETYDLEAMLDFYKILNESHNKDKPKWQQHLESVGIKVAPQIFKGEE